MSGIVALEACRETYRRWRGNGIFAGGRWRMATMPEDLALELALVRLAAARAALAAARARLEMLPDDSDEALQCRVRTDRT
jgi:hypothetical protein